MYCGKHKLRQLPYAKGQAAEWPGYIPRSRNTDREAGCAVPGLTDPGTDRHWREELLSLNLCPCVIPKRGAVQPREGSPKARFSGKSLLRLKSSFARDDRTIKLQLESLPY